MVYIDPKRQSLELAVVRAKEGVEDAEWELRCYDYSSAISIAGLEPGKDRTFGTLKNVFYSPKPVEKCVFDNRPLRISSPIFGGSGQTDHALYSCPKCKAGYIAPLNEKDQKAHDTRMKRMVFA
jgi:hypothetical protein